MLNLGQQANFVRETEPLSQEELTAIDNVSSFIGSRNAVELERLATVSWIRFQEKLTKPAEVTSRLHFLKPHVPISEATRVDGELLAWLGSNKDLGSKVGQGQRPRSSHGKHATAMY